MVYSRYGIKKAFSIAAVGVLFLANGMPASAADVTWTGGDGAKNWHDAANWDTADVPGEGNNNTAILGNAAANRTISGNPSGGKIDWDQTTSGVTQTIVMDRFWNPPWGLAADSTAAGGSGLILDLNGNRLKLNMTAVNTINGMKGVRIVDTNGSGWLESDNIGLHANSSVGPGVLMVSGRGESRSFGSWDPTATIRGTQTRFDINQINGTGLGNVLQDVADQRMYLMENDTEGRVQGDWTINAAGAYIRFAGSGRNLIVNGNWTDTNSNDGKDYTNGAGGSRITFAGDPASPRTVNIGRSLLIDFAVGHGGEDGNIALGSSLTTSGSFGVLAGSKVDVGLNTLSTGDLSLAGALAIGLGSSGQVAVTGAANLGGGLTVTGTFANPVVLIDNDGSDPLAGTFAIENLPAGTSLNYLGGDGNDLVLTPEPASLALLTLCGAAVLRRRRR